MRVTHGCVRMYPEDIEHLFGMVPVGTPVRLIDQPVKVGRLNGQLMIESHAPLEEDDLPIKVTLEQAHQAVIAKTGPDMPGVDQATLELAVEQVSGIPVPISMPASYPITQPTTHPITQPTSPLPAEPKPGAPVANRTPIPYRPTTAYNYPPSPVYQPTPIRPGYATPYSNPAAGYQPPYPYPPASAPPVYRPAPAYPAPYPYPYPTPPAARSSVRD